jgi:hypothetical protein
MEADNAASSDSGIQPNSEYSRLEDESEPQELATDNEDSDSEFIPNSPEDESDVSMEHQSFGELVVVTDMENKNSRVAPDAALPFKNKSPQVPSPIFVGISNLSINLHIEYNTPSVLTKNGKRCYNKMQSCMFCPEGTLVSHFSNHCKSVHLESLMTH